MPLGNKALRLRAAAHGYNEVTVYIDPKGDVIIGLTNVRTDDEMVYVRVKPADIDFFFDDGDGARIGRVNLGGAWDG